MFRLKNKKMSTSGFTLIEALVAISILMISVAGPLVAASTGLQNSMYARDQIVAFYIAQEGIEMIRAVRDGNALNNTPWLTGIAASCTAVGGACGIDIRNRNFIDCTGALKPSCNIYYDSKGLIAGGSGVRGIYSHVSGGTQQTVYNRTITISPIVANQESTIDVTVTWISRGATKTITVQSRLFNQYDNLGVVSMSSVPELACTASTQGILARVLLPTTPSV